MRMVLLCMLAFLRQSAGCRNADVTSPPGSSAASPRAPDFDGCRIPAFSDGFLGLPRSPIEQRLAVGSSMPVLRAGTPSTPGVIAVPPTAIPVRSPSSTSPGRPEGRRVLRWLANHHTHERQGADKAKRGALAADGWTVLSFWGARSSATPGNARARSSATSAAYYRLGTRREKFAVTRSGPRLREPAVDLPRAWNVPGGFSHRCWRKVECRCHLRSLSVCASCKLPSTQTACSAQVAALPVSRRVASFGLDLAVAAESGHDPGACWQAPVRQLELADRSGALTPC